MSESAPAAPIGQSSGEIQVTTNGPGLTDITAPVEHWLKQIGATEGILTLFVRHTSASLTIQENADPDVRDDLMAALGRLAPEDAGWRHTTEGPDDMPAHVKSMLTSVSIAVPVLDRTMRLGTWQGVYVIEHRTAPHQRHVALHFLGSFRRGQS
ncbi:MAG: secondary thiamine-phosphate synthase enzyme YjbQ [Hyphomicrobiaceae bacterium]